MSIGLCLPVDRLVLRLGTFAQLLVLENLSHPFLKPNILDIKLGTVLHDEEASPEKVERMIKTARETTSLETGVRLTGFQVSSRSFSSSFCFSFLYLCFRAGMSALTKIASDEKAGSDQLKNGLDTVSVHSVDQTDSDLTPGSLTYEEGTLTQVHACCNGDSQSM